MCKGNNRPADERKRDREEKRDADAFLGSYLLYCTQLQRTQLSSANNCCFGDTGCSFLLANGNATDDVGTRRVGGMGDFGWGSGHGGRGDGPGRRCARRGRGGGA